MVVFLYAALQALPVAVHAWQCLQHVHHHVVLWLIDLVGKHGDLSELGPASQAVQFRYASFQKGSHCMDAGTIGIAAPPFNPCELTQCQPPGA